MPRTARTVFAGIPHHVTQRGNRKENVFFDNLDRLHYLTWLAEYCLRNQVEVLAYCLMTNHVHLVMVPATPEGLHLALKPLHMRYAQYMNKKKDWNGHLWQGRYFSSPLDDEYTWSAIRYVEQNPVRAGMVDRAENYQWSSAAAHCGLRADEVLTSDITWRRKFKLMGEWSVWINSGACPEGDQCLRTYVEKGLPCGSPLFVNSLEKIAGRSLSFRPQGREKKKGTLPFKG